MKIERRCFLTIAVVLLPLLAFSIGARANNDDGEETTFRWDIIRIEVINGVPTLIPNGTATATAADNSVITLTGSGTFASGDAGEVTGGGTWQTATGRGTYRVTRLIRFDVAPGSIPSPPINDTIGNASDGRAGLVFLAIRYSDGSRGILVVSCNLPVGTPASVLEGVTASKGFVDFFTPATGNTVFHIVSEVEID